MTHLYKKAGVFFSTLLIVFLITPTLQTIKKIAPESTLYGYTDPIPEKPTHYIASFFDKSLQQWIEKKFNSRLGFRAGLIRSFNEIDFRLFRETDNSRLKLMTTRQHGLYSNLSIDSLNDDIMHKEALEKEYQAEANQLLAIQNKLTARGKYFEVVIASSKAYVYPKGLGQRLLVGGSKNIFNRAANFSAILKATGVHVIDSGPILRNLVRTQKIETHPSSGLHWNYYSACLIAQNIVEHAQQTFPTMAGLDCGTAQRIPPPMNDVDVDGYSLLNIWSGAGLLQLTTYPTIQSIQNPLLNWHPNIVFIGDSFSDQIRFAFKKAHVYSHLVMSSYFKQREIDDANGPIDIPDDGKPFEPKLLADIGASDIIILEMVDYNTHKKLYGFADYFLQYA